MSENIFKHRFNVDQDGSFLNLQDNIGPCLQRAAAIADLIEVACEVTDPSSFAPDTLWRAAQAMRFEIVDAQAFLRAEQNPHHRA